MTLGGIDLLRSGLIKGVDIYLEAGQSPQVVIRPVLLDQVTVDLTAGDLDGKAPRCVVAPDVAYLLEELGWVSPDSAEVVHHTLATRDRERDELKTQLAGLQSQHQVALDRIRGLESEREELSRAHFSCGDKMVTLEQERDQWRTSFNQAHETEAHLSRQAAQLQDALTEARERISAQEAELESAAQAVEKALDEKAQMAEELASAHGQIDDLKLANQTLQETMDALQAEAA
ncbi:MAG TPA: hypothetical protein VFU47_11120 [Armatimonadota bacterium]|nr:hypothetical protein [Armatimonadota bacterium]